MALLRNAAALLLGCAGAALLPTHRAEAWWVPGPVVIAPPPVVYAPAPYPLYGRPGYVRWVPAHWDRWGRWHRAHWH